MTTDLEMIKEIRRLRTVIREREAELAAIQSALGTEETGDALVEVARNAHRAELEAAAAHRIRESLEAEARLNNPHAYE